MKIRQQRVLPRKALSWNVLSGNVSNPTIMKIPLVTNTVRMPLVTGGVPFSMNRGALPGFKHDSGAVPGLKHDAGKKQASQEMPGNASQKDKVSIPKNAETLLAKDSRCPWCGGSNIARELRSAKRSLWRCLGCNRRWWASADNPQKRTLPRKLREQVYQGSFWRQLGGIGW